MPVTDSPASKLNRRSFLSMAALTGVFAATGGALASCSGGGSGSAGGSGSGGGGGAAAKLPTYVPFKKIKPDLPSTTDGVQPAFFKYPSKLVKTVDSPPGKGKTLEAMVLSYSVVPAKSTYTDAVNKALNTTVKFDAVPEQDYAQRFSTVVAGGSLPDTILIPFADNLPSIGAFLKAKCVDLSKYVSGDAVKKYPNLAAIPTIAWKNARVNGSIYGMPISRGIFGRAPFYRKDIVEKRGVALPTTADEFMKFCKEFTNHAVGEYAIAGFSAGAISPLVLILISAMFHVPNQWREKDGKLTYYIETDEFKESVAYTKKLWDAGVFYPDTPSMNSVKAGDLFTAGKCIIQENGDAGWSGLQINGEKVNPDFLAGAIPAFGAKGGPGSTWFRPGAFGYSVITNGAKDRVEEILAIMNYLAAPFGSEEYNLINFGVKGVDYNDSPAGPLKTAQGTKEIATTYNYVAAPEQVLFDPANVDKVIKPHYEWETKVVKHGAKDPTVGLYSETASRSLAPILTQINDTITSVVVGRKSMSDLSQTVDAWNAGGGKQITAEYEKALKKAS